MSVPRRDRRSGRKPLIVVALVMCLVVAACTDSPSPTTSTSASSPASASLPASASSPSASSSGTGTAGSSSPISTSSTSAAPASSAGSDPRSAEIASLVQKAMKTDNLKAVIVKVSVGDDVVIRRAFGESMNGVPATPEMHFRNGAVAFAYLATLLLLFVDEKIVGLDDPIKPWEPNLPNADKVTLRMLTNQTSGYPDFETDDAWTTSFNLDPFQTWSYQTRLDYAFRRKVQFEPGTNWSYSHTNFMILGDALAKIGKKPLATLVQERVLDPMGLTNTTARETGAIPEPVLHSYSSERRPTLKIPPKQFFYEEATFWNADWGVPVGANQTTTIDDMITTATAVGTGKLLSKESYTAMTASSLLGFGKKEANCEPSCFTQIPAYNFGLGVIKAGNWILQDPLVGGYSATEAYLPSQKIAIAVAVTYLPGAFNEQGVEPNSSDPIFRAIGAVMAPDDRPPLPP